MRVGLMSVALCAAMLSALPAAAQKSKDTLRLGLNDPFVILSPYQGGGDEASNFTRSVYETLLVFDERNKKWIPSLAKSWTRIDNRTLEFELREGILFHNGNTFDADDVVNMVDYLKHPASQINFKQRFLLIEKAEKLGPYKVRIVFAEPIATDMANLAYRYFFFDAETMAKHADRDDYGRLTPIGTGPMKIAVLDKNKGVVVEAIDKYHGDKTYFRAGMKRVHGVPIPDRQTQIAQLVTGGIDMIRNASPDDTRELDGKPNLDVTYSAVLNLYYMGFDVRGKSGINVFGDERVRRAVWMSIDRESIVKYIVPGGDKVAEMSQWLCFKTTTPDCKPTVPLPKFDPEGAKKLLAEAGYPNGIEYNYYVTAPHRAIAEAIAGSLLKANIRANVRPVPLSVYRKEQVEGKFNAWSTVFPTGSFPDASNNLDTLILGHFDQYYGDEDLKKLLSDGLAEFDEKKRAAIYHQAYDMVNRKSYLYPFSSIPNAYVHTKDIRIMDNPYMAGETTVTDYFWK